MADRTDTPEIPEMVERVARAIYDAPNGIDGDQIADMLYEDGRISGKTAEECRAQVLAVCRMASRAAIAAMREPVWRMLDAANDAFPEPPTTMTCGEFGKRLWQAMVDAALGGRDDPQ